MNKLINGFGFKKRSSPIIFTVDGKLIGDKAAFKKHVIFTYGLKSDLDPVLRSNISDFDKSNLDETRFKESRGPSLNEILKPRLLEIKSEGTTRVLEEIYIRKIDHGLEFFVKSSEQLSPFLNDNFQYQLDVPFITIPEFTVEEHENQPTADAILINDMQSVEQEPVDKEESKVTEVKENEEEEEEDEDPDEAPKEEQKLPEDIVASQVDSSDEEDSLMLYEVNDANLNEFIEKFSGAKSQFDANLEETVQVPETIKALLLPDSYVIDSLRNDFILAANPYAIVSNEMILFQSEGTDQDGNWLIRDSSMMKNWLKVLNIPSQRPVFREGSIIDPVIPREPMIIRNFSGNLLNRRGYSDKQLDLTSLECTKNSSLRLNTINIHVRHLLTEVDWETWHSLVVEIDALGFYQFLPYGEQK